MSRKSIIFGLISLAAILFPAVMPVFAGFEDTGIGGRQMGMGGAFCALADDVNSIFYNPAGLDRIKWIELSMFTGKLYEGLTDESSPGNGFLGLNVPLGIQGNFGAGWLNFSLPGYYSENTYIVSYARKVEDPLKKGFLSLGVNMKILSSNFETTAYTEQAVNLDTGYLKGGADPVFENGYAVSALALDAGILYSPLYNPEHNFALVLRNFNQPDMGLLGEDRVARELKFGYAYTARQFNIAVDLSFERQGTFISAGFEKFLAGGAYALRGGVKTGSQGYRDFTFGAMYRYNDVFQFDYGFALPLAGITSAYGSHRLSVVMRFGDRVPVFVDRTMELSNMERKLESAMDRVESADSPEKMPEARELLMKTREDTEKTRQEISISKEKQQQMIDSYYSEGLAEYSGGNVDRAIMYWEHALRLDPENSKIKNAIEQARRESGRQ